MTTHRQSLLLCYKDVVPQWGNRTSHVEQDKVDKTGAMQQLWGSLGDEKKEAPVRRHLQYTTPPFLHLQQLLHIYQDIYMYLSVFNWLVDSKTKSESEYFCPCHCRFQESQFLSVQTKSRFF